MHRIFPKPRKFWLRILDFLLGILIGVGFYFFGGILISWIRTLIITWFGAEFYIGASEGSVNTSPPSLTLFELILGIFVMFLLIGVAEEFCFRGVLLKEIGKKRQFLGIVLSSLIFSLYHVFPGVVPMQTTVTYWFYYFTFGVLLSGIVLLQKRDLLTAIVAHGTFNSIIWVFTYVQF